MTYVRQLRRAITSMSFSYLTALPTLFHNGVETGYVIRAQSVVDDVTKIMHMRTRKLCYRKDDRAMRPTYGWPEHFRDSPDYAHGHYSQHYHAWAFVPIDPMNVPTKFEVRSLTRS